jgi:hypothetical protein
MLRQKFAISGAVMALAIGASLLPHVGHAISLSMSVTPSPFPPMLVGGKATVTATVVPKTPQRTIRFDVTSGTAHVTTAVTKLALPVLVGDPVIVVSDPTGFISGEPITIDGVGSREHLTLAVGPVTATLTLASPATLAHAAGSVVTTASALTDLSTGQATATVTAGPAAGTETLTVTDVTDPLVLPVVTTFAQALPVPLTLMQRFVNAVYQDLLNRLPDAGSLAFWSGSIDAAGNSIVTRGAFVSAITSSPEYRADVISNFFSLYLNRGIDQNGLDFWVGQMAGGLSFEQVRLAFVGSPEFFNITNAGSPSQAINALYKEVLGRPDGDASDPGGLAYWLANFNAGAIASQFLFSPEGRQSLVSGYYQTILHRTADVPGLGFWTQRLLTGASDENILLQLLSSDEFNGLL